MKYPPSTFADYAGAHIDIATKENPGKDYLNVSLSTGGRLNTTFNNFRYSDKSGGLRIRNLPQAIKNMSSKDFIAYSKQQNPFDGGDFLHIKNKRFRS